jgi:hypothetical protein
MQGQGRFKGFIHAIRWTAPLFDVLMLPLTFIAAAWFRIVRSWGLFEMPLTKKAFLGIGMFPIVDHYYDPLFDYRRLSNDRARTTYVEMNAVAQIKFVSTFNYSEELRAFPRDRVDAVRYYLRNGSFEAGDAELYYSIVRKTKPRRIIEVGSGFSTRVATEGISKNRQDDDNYTCSVTCVEPYEMPWLSKLDVELVRKKVEDLDLTMFQQLEAGDILFIDSSHIIRPGGDVTFEILNILPSLTKGVLVHFHDIFTPADYPVDWLKHHFRFWNEQYLLEAFLTGNNNFEVICALNFLVTHHWKQIEHAFPLLAMATIKQPGSMWLRKIT